MTEFCTFKSKIAQLFVLLASICVLLSLLKEVMEFGSVGLSSVVAIYYGSTIAVVCVLNRKEKYLILFVVSLFLSGINFLTGVSAIVLLFVDKMWVSDIQWLWYSEVVVAMAICLVAIGVVSVLFLPHVYRKCMG